MHRLLLAALASFGLALGACSAAPETASESVDSDAEAIIGGVAANDPSLDGIGALVTIYRYSGSESYSSPFCSASLISNREVLTAKHCVATTGPGTEIGFAVGPDANRPRKVYPVVFIERESTIKGGFISMGADVAVLHLGERVKDITPLAVAAIAPEDVSKRFVAVGYGTQDTAGTSGTRRAGSMTFGGTGGRFWEHSFGSFDAFLKATPQIGDVSWQVGDPTTPDGQTRARTIFDSTTLLDDYEGFFGATAGDAQSCHGDSGGPMLRTVNGQRTVFGVTSWGQHQSGSFCAYGSVYAVLGPAAKQFVDQALTWVDPCEGTTVKGRCDGATATRCSSAQEGDRRLLVTECAELGQACGAGTDGQVACVASR